MGTVSGKKKRLTMELHAFLLVRVLVFALFF